MRTQAAPLKELTNEKLAKLAAKLVSERDVIEGRLAEIRSILNNRHAESYRFVRFDALKGDLLNCIKALREVSHSATAALGLKEAKDFCDMVRMGSPMTMEFREATLTADLVATLNTFFDCAPVCAK